MSATEGRTASAGAVSSIVLPVHNQADHITGVVGGYVAALSSQSPRFELILVTNACTDDSVERCAQLERSYSQVRLIELEEGGWGRAVRTGLALAEGDVLGYTNSARTTSNVLALLLLYATVYPEVVVKANRRVRESLRRRFGSLLYNLECRALFDLAVWDINGTPKIFPRSFDKLLDLSCNDDLLDLEFNVVCRRAGYPVVEVPILTAERHGGKSTTNLRSALRMYAGAIALKKQLRA
jgi:glycosyltransferase involved in cell wall biosynthesis